MKKLLALLALGFVVGCEYPAGEEKKEEVTITASGNSTVVVGDDNAPTVRVDQSQGGI